MCAIRDGISRKGLGYSISNHIGAELVTTAIDRAVAGRGGRCRETILHSDRGGEYTAHLTAASCPSRIASVDGCDRDLLGQQSIRIVLVDVQARGILSARLREEIRSGGLTAGSSSATPFDDTRQWGCEALTAMRSHFRLQLREVCNPLVHRSGGTSLEPLSGVSTPRGQPQVEPTLRRPLSRNRNATTSAR